MIPRSTPRLSPERALAVLIADEAIAWARITSHMEIQRMNKHSLDYVDLHPKPVERDDGPSDLMIWLGAAVAVAAGLAGLVILMGMTP